VICNDTSRFINIAKVQTHFCYCARIALLIIINSVVVILLRTAETICIFSHSFTVSFQAIAEAKEPAVPQILPTIEFSLSIGLMSRFGQFPGLFARRFLWPRSGQYILLEFFLYLFFSNTALGGQCTELN